jgi:Subtilase family/Fibronectin type-III domain
MPRILGLLVLLLLPTAASAATRYLVELRGTPSSEQFARFRRDATAVLGKRGGAFVVRHELRRVFHGVAVTIDAAALESVRALPYVAAVHVEKEMQLFGTDVTHLDRIGAKHVWTSLGARGRGVTIAVIDTGVDRNHPELAGRYAGGWDFVDHDAEPEDPHGHGTHVAGTALGATHGVAPEAKLLAYRVINEHGLGNASDVMAALERAIDNGADVINLSLGSIYGTSDDPEALAVDEAVEAGAVVALAAGNFGGSQSIGSPATSRLGIVVGNADANDALLYDSSYGPVHPELVLKPDVVAPGEEILSARTGGGATVKSGTSMASPHVAGAAALLLELHPDWTPEQVKGALIATAQPTAEAVMKRGGGRIDVHRAATATAWASPASLAFGRMRGMETEWTATRVVRVTAAAAQTFRATMTPQAGIEVTIEPASFTLAAGESRDVTITLRAKDLPPVPLDTLGYGGTIAFSDSLRVPWVFVHAALVTTTSDGFVTWSCGDGFTGRPPGIGTTSTTLLPAGDCTAIMRTETAAVLESRTIRADETLSIGSDRAPYRLIPAGVDEQGRPLHAQSGYATLHRVDFGPSRMPRFMDFTAPPRFSAMPDDVTITSAEIVSDLTNGRVVAVEHAPLRGIDGDRTLVNSTSALAKTRVRVLPASGTLGVALTNGDTLAVTSTGMPLNSGWSGDVFLDARTIRPVFLTHQYRSAPITADAVLGEKPLFAQIELLTRETRFGFYADFIGPMGERHHRLSQRYEARDASGALVAQGDVVQFTIVEHSGPGAYTLTLRGNGAGTTTFSFDTRRADPIPPSLTSARVVNGDVVFTASEPVTSRVSHSGGQIRLEITDGSGNSCTWTLPNGDTPRRRSAGH